MLGLGIRTTSDQGCYWACSQLLHQAPGLRLPPFGLGPQWRPLSLIDEIVLDQTFRALPLISLMFSFNSNTSTLSVIPRSFPIHHEHGIWPYVVSGGSRAGCQSHCTKIAREDGCLLCCFNVGAHGSIHNFPLDRKHTTKSSIR